MKGAKNILQGEGNLTGPDLLTQLPAIPSIWSQAELSGPFFEQKLSSRAKGSEGGQKYFAGKGTAKSQLLLTQLPVYGDI